MTMLSKIILLTMLIVMASGCSSLGNNAVADRSWVQSPRIVVDPDSGRPYVSHQVFVPSGSTEIASTLLVPQTQGLPPLIITVSGAGEGLVAPEAPVYRRLVARGYAVLALGKQGVGSSSGNWRRESFEDRARNVAAAIEWAASRNDVDGTRVVLHGHSQGGYVIPLVQADPRVVALILAAGPARPVRHQIVDDIYTTMVFSGHTERHALAKATRTRRMLDVGIHVCPLANLHYLCNVYRFDPASHLSAIEKPVLVLFNELDQMVPPTTNLDRMRALLADNAFAEIHVLPTADHDHIHNPSGLQSKVPHLIGPEAQFPFAVDEDVEHARLAKMWVNRVRFADGYLDLVERFVLRHVPVAGQQPGEVDREAIPGYSAGRAP